MASAKGILTGWRRVVACGAAAAAVATAVVGAQRPAAPSVTPAPAALAVDQRVTAAVGSSESHRYAIRLPADRWISLSVEQTGARPLVTIVAPDGTTALASRGGPRQHDRRVLTFVTSADGEYRIDVSGDRDAVDGAQCTISVAPPREPSADERMLDEARVLLARSDDLVRTGKYDAALEAAQRALALRERVLGSDHPLVADALHAIAIVYDNKAKYADAEPVNVRALAIRERAFGPVHPDVAASLYNLAWIYLTRQDYVRAESTYRRVLDIQEQTIGPTSRETTSTLNDLAILYNQQGNYDKSAEIDERVVSIRERVLGPDDAAVAKTLSNLGLDYVKKGDFRAAEDRLLRAVRIAEKALGPDHPDLALAVNNLALVYEDKGDYAAAEPLQMRALAIYEKALGPEHPTVAVELNNVGWLLQHEGRYEEARPLLVRALAIREKALGPNHSDVAEALTNLAALDIVRRAPVDSIEPLLERALAIFERTLGPEHEKVAAPLGNRAALSLRRHQYAEAAALYERALAIREKALGPDHPNVADLLRGAAIVYRAAGDRARALAYWTKYSDVVERNFERNLPIGSERQKQRYVGLFAADIDDILSFDADAPSRTSPTTALALTAVLRSKGRALDAMTDTVGLLRSRAGDADQALFTSLAAARARLAAATLHGPGPVGGSEYRVQLARLNDAVESAERAISARSAEYRAESAAVTLDAVRAALPPASVLVEFARYRPTAVDVEADARAARYAAFLLSADGAPERVDLGDAASMETLVDAWRTALRDPRRSDVLAIARELDDRLMRPVRDRIGDRTRLLISPDGLLNLIPFGALVDEHEQYLVERYSITYLTSGRDLLRLRVARPAHDGAVVIADPAYGDPVLRGGRGAAASIDYSQTFFGPLPGVASEVRALRTLLPDATFLTKDAATKSALMAVKGPRILHIATHGYFLDDEAPARRSPAVSTFREDDTRLGKAAAHVENPLLRSGLALAGANHDAADGGAGVLTALEAADLDLWGTRLVVLSSCDTGVGDVRTGDGVYGLRRALVLSGAESQLMTLWPVSDRGTRDVIVNYYRALLAGDGRGDALRAAQRQMLHSGGRAHPYYWAGFILSGQWASLAAEP